MPGRPGRRARLRAEAVAKIAGAEVAAQASGADVTTVRAWMADAPDPTLEVDEWRSLMGQALSVVRSDLEAGRLSTVQAATVAAIARRNAERPREVEPADPWDAYHEALASSIEARWPGCDAHHHALGTLIWRHRDEPERAPVDPPTPEDVTVLVADDLAYLEGLGDGPEAWLAVRRAESQRVRRRAELVASFLKAGVWPPEEAQRLADDANVTALIAQAERYLEVNA